MRQLALAGGFNLGFPTGSIQDGTGGQWALTPFLGTGKLVGPMQLMADVSFQDDFRAAPDGGKAMRELLYNLAVAYPLFETQLLPFLEVNGAYAFSGVPTIRHRGQISLMPGVRISPTGWWVALAEPRPTTTRTAQSNALRGESLVAAAQPRGRRSIPCEKCTGIGVGADECPQAGFLIFRADSERQLITPVGKHAGHWKLLGLLPFLGNTSLPAPEAHRGT